MLLVPLALAVTCPGAAAAQFPHPVAAVSPAAADTTPARRDERGTGERMFAGAGGLALGALVGSFFILAERPASLVAVFGAPIVSTALFAAAPRGDSPCSYRTRLGIRLVGATAGAGVGMLAGAAFSRDAGTSDLALAGFAAGTIVGAAIPLSSRCDR